MQHAPGPTSVRATTAAMKHTPLQFLLEMTHRYGDVVRLPLLSGSVYLINHPDGVRHVLQDRAANYGKAPHENGIFTRFVGQSILTTEGDAWLRLRRLEQPAFHRRHILDVGGPMIATIQAYLDEWHDKAERGDLVNMVPAMAALSLHVLGNSLFTLNLGEDAETIAAGLKVIGAYALALFYQPLLPYLGPLVRRNRQRKAAQRALDEVVFRLIHKSRTQLTNHLPKIGGFGGETVEAPEDLLTFFLCLQDEAGQPAFTDAEIHNELLSLLIAGHENSSSLLCWTWYLLSQHPLVAERVYDEVKEQLKGRAPTLDDLARLPYSRMVLEEALRLYPPAWSFPRRALADDTIGGYPIPAGATVLLCPYTTHRHSAFWHDPEAFDPERFSKAAEAARPRYAHFPFGGGQHQCMGAPFAMIEAHLIVAMMAQRYQLELEPGTSIQPDPLVTLRPKELPMRLRLAP